MVLPFTIRQSTLETSRCLYRLYSEQILGIKEPESEPAQRGSDFHALQKLYVDYLVISKQELDWSFAEEIIARKDWNEEAVQIFRPWVQSNVFDPSRVFATEYQIRLDANFNPCSQKDAVYSGDFDRLEMSGDEAEIIDAKTHFLAFNPTTIQAVFYPYLLFKLMGHLKKITFTLDFVRYNIKRSREFTQDNLQQMDRYVQAHVRRLEEAYRTDCWPAAINSKCAYCRLSCPLVNVGMAKEAIGQVGTMDSAKEMAQELFALSRRAKQIKDALKSYAMESGPIDAGNDIHLGFSKRAKWTYDVRSVVKLNEDHGFDPLRALSVNPAEIKKVGRSYPEYVETARKSAKDKSTTAFQFVNVVGDPLEEDDEEDEIGN